MMTEDVVQKTILDRVMSRLEGRDFDSQGYGEGAPNTAAQQLKVQQEVARVKAMGAELMGIAGSIESLIELYNRRIDDFLSGHDSLIKLPADQYRSIFTSNVGRLDELIEREIEQRQELNEQQAEFDKFIQNKVQTFLEARKEMENNFILQYQKAWMQKELA